MWLSQSEIEVKVKLKLFQYSLHLKKRARNKTRIHRTQEVHKFKRFGENAALKVSNLNVLSFLQFYTVF